MSRNQRRTVSVAVAAAIADGSFMLTPWGAGASDGPTVVDVRTGDLWVLPRAWSPSVVAWSYGDLALVQVHHDDTGAPLLACHAVERDCERLAHQGSVLLPTS